MATERSHQSRLDTILRIRGHTRRPSRLRESITPDTPIHLDDIVAPERASNDDQRMVSTSPNEAATEVPHTQPSVVYTPPKIGTPAQISPTQTVGFFENVRNIPAQWLPPSSPLTEDGDSKADASSPKTHDIEQSPRSVKNITCYWWAIKQCRYTEDECLYAHSIQKTIGEQPRKLNPNGPPVAGRNAHSSRPIHRDWRQAHRLPGSVNNASTSIARQQSKPQESSQQQQIALTTKIETLIRELKAKRDSSESAIADICDKVDSELRRGRDLQSQLGYFEAVPKTEIIMKWATEVNEIVRQHRIIIDSINEKLIAMGKL